MRQFQFKRKDSTRQSNVFCAFEIKIKKERGSREKRNIARQILCSYMYQPNIVLL